MTGFSVSDVLGSRGDEANELWAATINPQFVRVLKTIGFDRTWVRGEGAYLWDAKGERYLDLIGRLRHVQRRAQQPARPRRADRGAGARPAGLGAAGCLAPAAAARRGASARARRARLGRVLFTNTRHRGGRGGAQARTCRDGARAGALGRTRLSRAHARVAVGQREPRVHRPLRAAPARVRARPVR